MRHLAVAVIFAQTLAGHPALADDASIIAEARKCSNLEAAGARMTCYDHVFQGDGTALLPIGAKEEEPEPVTTTEDGGGVIDLRSETAPGPQWDLTQRRSSMTDKVDAQISVQSSNDIVCSRFGQPEPVTLTIRCVENTTALIIGGNCHLVSGFSGYGNVKYRIDDEKPVTKEFSASTSNRALGLWNGGSSIPVIKSMIGKGQMIARFTPFNENPVEATFDISDMETKLNVVRKACGW